MGSVGNVVKEDVFYRLHSEAFAFLGTTASTGRVEGWRGEVQGARRGIDYPGGGETGVSRGGETVTGIEHRS